MLQDIKRRKNMEENLKIDCLMLDDIYKLEEKTGIIIMIGGRVDQDNLGEAIRKLIREN